MSSNLDSEEPMAADPAKNPGGEELGGESSAVETTGEGEIRVPVETIVEEKTAVVVGETKEDLFGSELGSESKPTGGLQGDDLLEVSLKNPGCVESGEVDDGVEEVNDPTEISLDDLTGGLDMDGKPTRGDVVEVVMEGSVDEVAGKAKDALVDAVSVEQIQDPENRPTEEVLEQPAPEGFTDKEPSLAEGIQEDETAEVGEYTSEKEVGQELEKGRLVDGDNVIEPGDTVKVLEGADDILAEEATVVEPKEVAEKNTETSNKPNVDESPMVEEYEEVTREVTSDSCIEPMNVTTSTEVLAVGPVHVGIENISVEMAEQGTEAEQPMDIDGDTTNFETIEPESGKEVGGDKLELEAVEVDADKEISILGKYQLICGLDFEKKKKNLRPWVEMDGLSIFFPFCRLRSGIWYSQHCMSYSLSLF